MQIDTIDWHDFVVVEKIDLYDDEEMKAQEDAELEELKEQERIKE
jgi:G3E family GTPase